MELNDLEAGGSGERKGPRRMWFVLECDDEGEWNLCVSSKDECLELVKDSENDHLFPCHSKDEYIDDIEFLIIEIDFPEYLYTYEINNVTVKSTTRGIRILSEAELYM
jgi:hypothetical protein